MIYRGQVRNGVVIFEDAACLPEGSKVVIQLDSSNPAAEPGQPKTIYERLKRVAGKIHDLPPDASENLDHYLYGTPKQE